MAQQQRAEGANDQAEQPVYYRRPALAEKAGWIVAGFFGLVAIFVILYFIILPGPAERTLATYDPEILTVKKISVSPEVVLGALPRAPGNAAADYSQAVAVMNANLRRIGKYIGEEAEDYYDEDYDEDEDSQRRRRTPADVMAVLEKIAAHVNAGAAKATMNYTFVYTPKQFKVGYFYRPADDLEKLTSALDTLAAIYVMQKKYPQAEAVLKAEFTMGRHMTNERIRVDMVMRGLAVQDVAVSGLKGLYASWGAKYAARNKGLADYHAAVFEVKRAYREKSKIVWHTRPNPGDVFYIIENDEDLSWRVQGLLALGLIRFTAGHSRGNTRKLNQLIEKYSAGKDPYLSAAARAARSFTREEFNQIGTKKY